MSDNLPRLQQSIPLVDQNGQPSMAFHVWWDKFAKAIESANADLQNQIDAINAAQAAADAAQAAADTAQATADSKAKVTRSNTAPTSPSVNDVWVDTSVTPVTAKVWDGSAWQASATKGADLAADVVNNTLANVTDTSSRKALATNAVQTSYIQDNAVTNPASAYTAASVNIPNTSTWTDMQSATLTATGAVISVQAGFYAGPFDASSLTTGSSGLMQWRIIRDSTVIFGPFDFGLNSSNSRGTGTNFIALLDQPSAGSHTYKLQGISNDASNACNPVARSIIVAEMKK